MKTNDSPPQPKTTTEDHPRPRRPAEKVLSRVDTIRRYGRPRNERVVFTNGCFDLLHRGHVEYLARARELGDILIVGLNSDDSVRRLKGPRRPLITQEDRATTLAAMECVDAVTIFDEDTPLDLIEAILPDTLVKGGDYDIHEIVGGREVQEHGGEVITLPFLQGRSTTTIIEKIRRCEYS